MCDKAGFLGKNPHQAKMTQNGQRWPKNTVFGLLKKIMSLVSSGICLKRKFLWFVDILQKLHAWKKSRFSSYSPKWLSTNEISVFFNCQYFINRLISDFDFCHGDRHEWKEQCKLRDFLKKSNLGKWAILGPKMAHRHNCGSAVRMFLNLSKMKRVIRKMKMILSSKKKNLFGANGSFWAHKWCIFVTWDPLGDFFLILLNERSWKGLIDAWKCY